MNDNAVDQAKGDKVRNTIIKQNIVENYNFSVFPQLSLMVRLLYL